MASDQIGNLGSAEGNSTPRVAQYRARTTQILKGGAPCSSESQKMGERMGSPPAIEDQARLLEDALVMVRQQTHQMRKCLETPGKLMDALKCR